MARFATVVDEPTAFLALATGGVWSATGYDFNLMVLLPQTRLGLGILLVAAGFLALTAGVWVNGWFRSPGRSIGHGQDDTHAAEPSRLPGIPGAPRLTLYAGIRSASALPGPILRRPIPGTGEQVPVVDMGSWHIFDVVVARFRRAQCPPAGGARI